jgi:hypothetical protein
VEDITATLTTWRAFHRTSQRSWTLKRAVVVDPLPLNSCTTGSGAALFSAGSAKEDESPHVVKRSQSKNQRTLKRYHRW